MANKNTQSQLARAQLTPQTQKHQAPKSQSHPPPLSKQSLLLGTPCKGGNCLCKLKTATTIGTSNRTEVIAAMKLKDAYSLEGKL